MNRSFSFAFAAFCVAGVTLATSAATRIYSPTVKSGDKYSWNTAENWKDENGESGKPVTGDTLILTGNQTVWEVNYITIESMTISFTAGSGPGLSGSGPSYSTTGRGITLTTASSPMYWLGISPAAGFDLPVDIQQAGGTLSFDEDITGNGRFVKRGPGTLILGSKAPNGTPGASNTRSFTWHGTVVEGGKARFGAYDYKMTGHELVFSGNDTTARVMLNNCDQTFINVNFYETNGVVNTDHGFASQTPTKANFLRFTGNPVQKPTVFSGKLYDKVGIVWAPDAATDAFVFSNAVSSTTGSLLVSNGVVRLVTDATFNSLEKLTVASGATFAIDEGSGDGFYAKSLELAAGGTLTLGARCDISFSDATIAGSLTLGAKAFLRSPTATGPDGALAEGRYTKDNTTWISGDGVLIVGSPAAADATWTGGGTTTAVTDPANWEGNVLPDLELGGTTATFGTDGSVATLGAADELSLNGIVLARGADFTFDAETGAQSVALAGQGIDADAAATPATYVMKWPLKLLQEQTWELGGNTLKVDAPLSGSMPKLTVMGPGRADFGVPGEFRGDVHLTNGTFYISGDNACCGAGTTLNLYLHKNSQYHFGTGTHDCKVNARATDDNNYPPLHFDANAKVVFNESFSRSGYVTMNTGSGSEITFNNGASFSQICKFAGSGRVIVTNKALSVGDRLYMQTDSGITLDLWVPTNKINGNIGEQGCGRINTYVPYALVEYNGTHQRLNMWGSFVLDLHGNDQAIGIFGGRGGSIRSDTPALLHYVANYDYNESQVNNRMTNSTAFVGCAGLSKEGTRVPFFLNGESSTTGTLQVVAGELTMLAKAAWPNSTNVVVTGGQLHLTHKDTFGKQVNVSISGSGKIDLAAGIRQRCAAYFLNGEEMPAGTYGATGSGATYVDDEHFAGAGILKAGKIGAFLLIR